MGVTFTSFRLFMSGLNWREHGPIMCSFLTREMNSLLRSTTTDFFLVNRMWGRTVMVKLVGSKYLRYQMSKLSSAPLLLPEKPVNSTSRVKTLKVRFLLNEQVEAGQFKLP